MNLRFQQATGELTDYTHPPHSSIDRSLLYDLAREGTTGNDGR
jgi:hypothetical protein